MQPIVLYRLEEVENKLSSLVETQASIAESLQRLVVIETLQRETHDKVQDVQKHSADQDMRLRALEKRQPTLDWAARVVGMFVLAMCGAALMFVWENTIANLSVDRTRQSPAVQDTTAPK